MPKCFFVAWMFAVILAAVLPIAIPYAIWPPYESHPWNWQGPDQAEIFGRYAQSRVYVARYFPSSVSVEAGPLRDASVRSSCGPASLWRLQRNYRATVKLRGAYGIPFSSDAVTCAPRLDWRFTPHAYGLLSVLAWLVGITAVSTPFILFQARNSRGEMDHTRS